MKLKYLIISIIALVAVTACKKELPVTQTEDVWEIVLSSDSGDIIPTKAGNLQKILSVKKNPQGTVTASLKKNGTDYDKSDLSWEFINTEKDVYETEDTDAPNQKTLRAIKKGGTTNNLEVQARVGGVLRGGIDADHGKYVDVKVIADYSIETPGEA